MPSPENASELTGPTTDETGDYEEQKKLVDNLRFEVQVLKEDVRTEQMYVENKQYVQAAQIKPLIDEKMNNLAAEIPAVAKRVSIQELSEVFQAEVVTPL